MNQNILEVLRSKLLGRTSFDTLPESIWKRSAALNTWGTNAIEGSTISRAEAERILLEERSVAGKPIRDVMETIQHEQAFRGLLERRKRKITLETTLELHEEVFRGILFEAGHWRRVNVRIRGARFTPPRMEKIQREMTAWISEYGQRDMEGEDIFELGAWMHFTFERIHPFGDGNGRIGRLLLNLHFLRRNWPPVHVLPQHRNDYLNALNTAHEGDYFPLNNLLKTLMGASLLDLLDQVGTKKDRLLSLKEAAITFPYSEKYLALRCKQGELPALREGREWRTSGRALELYVDIIGRKARNRKLDK
ncbi:MAG: Fic family protein [Thermoplasmata archaeon]|nr:MAG: Fic family protein [Thermoplasmata archaeon]